jgi:energy-coupling factor transporter ATP-binding protein EcfA2
MSSPDEISNIIFQTPFAALICGSTMSGKSTLLLKILQNADRIIYPPPTRIVYCSAQPIPGLESIKKLEHHVGLPDLSLFDSKETNILVLDDLQTESENSPEIMKLWTIKAHHSNISTFMLTHNLYSKNKYSRTISLNSSYLILFKSPRDKTQITYLARQMWPQHPKFLIEAFDDATHENYGYLFIDLQQKTKENLRVQSNIFSNRIIYQPK